MILKQIIVDDNSMNKNAILNTIVSPLNYSNLIQFFEMSVSDNLALNKLLFSSKNKSFLVQ